MSHIGIFWDIENCQVPKTGRAENIFNNITMGLQKNPTLNGTLISFSAYGDFHRTPSRIREACHLTGIKLVDVPNLRKEAADKAILVDMFLFALDNRPPSTIVLISGDKDFAPAMHILRGRGYTIIVVIPQFNVSSTLKKAGDYTWDWYSVVFGKKFWNWDKEATPHPNEASDTLMSGEQNALVPYVQPSRDIKELKGELVRLITSSGGKLSLDKLLRAYKTMYKKSLHVSQYGVSRLSKLLREMDDSLIIKGEGRDRSVCLHGPNVPAKKHTRDRSSK